MIPGRRVEYGKAFGSIGMALGSWQKSIFRLRRFRVLTTISKRRQKYQNFLTIPSDGKSPSVGLFVCRYGFQFLLESLGSSAAQISR